MNYPRYQNPATPADVEPLPGRLHLIDAQEEVLRAALRALQAERADPAAHQADEQDYALTLLFEAAKALFLTGLPEIVVLCGSTRFYPLWVQENYRLTCEGKIVLSVGFFPNAQQEAHGETLGTDPALKKRLDELHLRKIDLADRVFVIDPGQYIGESTAREIEYANRRGKPIEYLSARIALEAAGGVAQ